MKKGKWYLVKYICNDGDVCSALIQFNRQEGENTWVNNAYWWYASQKILITIKESDPKQKDGTTYFSDMIETSKRKVTFEEGMKELKLQLSLSML